MSGVWRAVRRALVLAKFEGIAGELSRYVLPAPAPCQNSRAIFLLGSGNRPASRGCSPASPWSVESPRHAVLPFSRGLALHRDALSLKILGMRGKDKAQRSAASSRARVSLRRGRSRAAGSAVCANASRTRNPVARSGQFLPARMDSLPAPAHHRSPLSPQPRYKRKNIQCPASAEFLICARQAASRSWKVVRGEWIDARESRLGENSVTRNVDRARAECRAFPLSAN